MLPDRATKTVHPWAYKLFFKFSSFCCTWKKADQVMGPGISSLGLQIHVQENI